MLDYTGRNAEKLKEKTLYLLDMDGTIYNENEIFDGTLEFLTAIREQGGQYIFITNNSSKSVEDYVEKVRNLSLIHISFDSIYRQTESVHPDMIEVLPGVMPKVIRRICQNSRVPVIAGGLISDKEDIIAALNAGAVSISTTNQTVWFM